MTVRRYLFRCACLVAVVVLFTAFRGSTAQKQIEDKDCLFLRSLHYTANGMRYWYSKKTGGLELVTGVPYADLSCKNCHTAGCDRCHKAEKEKTLRYSINAAKNQNMCLECHGREKAMIAIDQKANQEDVHTVQGMACANCHSAREMHGDGTGHLSMKQPNVMDTKCENCHEAVSQTEAHIVHQEKLDCKACHVRHVLSCTNCHFGNMVQKGVRKAMPVSGWMFLMNYAGKVTSANMQTFVAEGNKTFLIFAPHMSHSIMKKGRDCDECHGTETVKQAQKGVVKLTWLEDGKLANLKGMIPVVDAVDYQCVYHDLKDDKWVPLGNPAKPLRQYVAFGKPLTTEQLGKLANKQEAPPPQMKP